MKVGDLVTTTALSSWGIGVNWGIGVIIDCYEDEEGTMYYEVAFEPRRQWMAELELRLISESR